MVTDAAHLTPWWTAVGAIQVVVLAESVDQGAAGLQSGATGWLLRTHSAPGVASLALAAPAHQAT